MLSFRHQSSILIRTSLKDIPAFFADPKSLEMWDTSVAKVVPTSDGPLRVGYTFQTIGPAKGKRPGVRSDYVVTKLEPTVNEVALVNSKLFRRAVWTFRFAETPDGTMTTCIIEASVRPQFFLLALLLRFNGRALLGDLHRLKTAIENFSGTTTA